MTRRAKNILFIMFDQLRFDYLSCAGHPHLDTPHMDWLASQGVRFTRAYVQSPVCGASRMSTYTGRYVHSHGAAWNGFPLKVGEMTLGDHLRALDVPSWLIGKTHMRVDAAGMARLGLSHDSVIGARVSECGFDVFEREDGLWGEGPDGSYDTRRSPYNEYLKGLGYNAPNPWHDNANSALDEDGAVLSGWLMKNADRPANIREEHSETPWLTSRAMAFVDAHPGPWLCHLSYIKPHWPYIVPAPYHAMYGRDDILPARRDERERDDAHPVYAAFMDNVIGRAFRRDEVRERVIPAYMGLIKQCDDQMGRLFAHLRATGRLNDTMIVVTSDHGDYLGDHWLGEKDLFHDPSVKVPLIIYDPSPEADATRGTTCDALVESIDLAATFIETLGGKVPDHIIEGRSLRPFLEDREPEAWRAFAVSEYDYSSTPMAGRLGVSPKDARLFMLVDQRWKFVHAEGGFRPMLFDLEADPSELDDLARRPGHDEIITQMQQRLSAWARRPAQRTTLSNDDIVRRPGKSRRRGILLGAFDESDVDDELMVRYRGGSSDEAS